MTTKSEVSSAPAGKRFRLGLRRSVAVAGAAALVAGVGVIAAPSASAATGVAGYVDSWSLGANSVRVQGWELDRAFPALSGYVEIWVDATRVSRSMPTIYRPDVNAAFSTYGLHGFDKTISFGPGLHRICVYGIGVTQLRTDLVNNCRYLTGR